MIVNLGCMLSLLDNSNSFWSEGYKMELLIDSVDMIMIIYPSMVYLLDIMMTFLFDYCFPLGLLAIINIYV